MDAFLHLVLGLAFAGFWGAAAAQKWLDPARFRAIVAEYRLVPAALAAPVAVGLAAVETVLGVWWLTGRASAACALVTIVLLGGYACAIGINLVRGRVHIDCGCGGREQPLSRHLLARNAVLMLLAAGALLPVAPRVLGWPDYVAAAAALAVLALLQIAASQLLANAAQIGAWRRDA